MQYEFKIYCQHFLKWHHITRKNKKMHLKQKNVASCTQDKSYPGQVARRQLFTDYDSSIEYISIARNFRHDGHHNQGANFVETILSCVRKCRWQFYLQSNMGHWYLIKSQLVSSQATVKCGLLSVNLSLIIWIIDERHTKDRVNPLSRSRILKFITMTS